MDKFAMWLIDNVKLPAFIVPYVFGIGMGRWPHKVKEENDK